MTEKVSLSHGIAGETAVSVFTTSENKKLAPTGTVIFRDDIKARPGHTIELLPDHTFQSILGFGGAFTDAACNVFSRMPAGLRKRLFHELFEELRLNTCRTTIGASDYSTEAYTYDESSEPDPQLEHFSIAHDRKWVLPMLRQALKVNPDLFLFSSPWTPPGWMKPTNSMFGGNMARRYMDAYARYFVKFIAAYKKAGVSIRAVTVQNEVDTDQGGAMPQCSWPQEYEVDFVRYFLGPALAKHAPDVLIWCIDHNPNLWGRALSSLEAPDFRRFVDGIAWHTYGGDQWRISYVHDAVPDVSAYWTEGGPDVTDPNYARDWARWGRSFTQSLRNRCRSLTVWNLALDENGHPNIGPFPCGGLVTVNSRTHAVTRSGQFYALAQFSKHVRRGATVFESLSALANVDHVAFCNPDGERVLVVTNSGEARTVSVRLGGKVADIGLEANSISTLVWSD